MGRVEGKVAIVAGGALAIGLTNCVRSPITRPFHNGMWMKTLTGTNEVIYE